MDFLWYMGDNLELHAYTVKNLYQFTSFKELFKAISYKDSDLQQFLYQIYTIFILNLYQFY